jgi:hypothetical protein
MLMLAFTIFISVPIRNVLVTDPFLDRDPDYTLFFSVFENFKSFIFYPIFYVSLTLDTFTPGFKDNYWVPLVTCIRSHNSVEVKFFKKNFSYFLKIRMRI